MHPSSLVILSISILTPLPKTLTHKQIEILYQDEYLLVIHKEAGLPTVASGEEKDKTALRLLSEHLKSFNPLAKVYHINRLDKDVQALSFSLRAPSSSVS